MVMETIRKGLETKAGKVTMTGAVLLGTLTLAACSSEAHADAKPTPGTVTKVEQSPTPTPSETAIAGNNLTKEQSAAIINACYSYFNADPKASDALSSMGDVTAQGLSKIIDLQGEGACPIVETAIQAQESGQVN